MAGVSFDLLFGVALYLMSVWGAGRAFRLCTLPAILGELLAGILLGPECLDVVPFASDGTCSTLIFDGGDTGSDGSSDDHGRVLASKPACQAQHWTPRFSVISTEAMETMDIWSFAGTVGVTLLIMESGMHINVSRPALRAHPAQAHTPPPPPRVAV